MYFNVRVYGLLMNEEQEILLTDEQQQGCRFTKFPGGGLEYGEGLTDALKREFIEECHTPVKIISHFYTTDFFVKSAFNQSQVISIYYKIETLGPFRYPVKTKPFDFDEQGAALQAFRWKKLSDLAADDVTFPADRHVVHLLKSEA